MKYFHIVVAYEIRYLFLVMLCEDAILLLVVIFMPSRNIKGTEIIIVLSRNFIIRLTKNLIFIMRINWQSNYF
jgi:hypothetical protein